MFDFNLDEVEASNSVVPQGTYLVQVEKTELVDTKSGGQMIKAQFNIVGEEQNGRKIFENFNIANDNPEAVKIGLGQVKSLVLASGANLSKFTSPDQLVGLECLVTVKVKSSEEYGDSNSITSYKKLGGNTPTLAGKTPVANGAIIPNSDLPLAADGQPIF